MSNKSEDFKGSTSSNQQNSTVVFRAIATQQRPNLVILSPVLCPVSLQSSPQSCNIRVLVPHSGLQQQVSPAITCSVPATAKNFPTLAACGNRPHVLANTALSKNALLPRKSLSATLANKVDHNKTSNTSASSMKNSNISIKLNALCENCGVRSYNPLKCSHCKKNISQSTTSFMTQPLKRSCEQSFWNPVTTKRLSLSGSKFYGNGGLNEFMKYNKLSKNNIALKRDKRLVPSTPSTRKSTECIMISDSSDDDMSSKLPPDSLSTTATEEVVPPCASSTTVITSNSIENHDAEPKADKESTASDSTVLWKYDTLNVDICSVRIGQMHITSSSCLRLSGTDFSMSLSNSIVRLKWCLIERIELNRNPLEPCLFFTVKSECLGMLRSQLNMVPGKRPYFDPQGTGDQKFFIVYLSKLWFTAKVSMLDDKLCLIRRKLKMPSEFFVTLAIEEANIRQTSIAEAECAELTIPFLQTVTHSRTRSTTVKLNQDSNKHACISLGLCEPRRKLAIYPPAPAKGGITITNEDKFCLGEGEFVNDVIIDFYLKYTMLELISERDRERSHVFSCFFYQRLMQPDGPLSRSQDKISSAPARRHMRVKKWTRKVDLFSKDFIFIPINDAAHWLVAVICFPGIQTTSDDSSFPDSADLETSVDKIVAGEICSLQLDAEMCNKSTGQCEETPVSESVAEATSLVATKQPCILVFDSLKGACRSKTVKYLREYLTEEWRNRKSAELGERVFDCANMKMCSPQIPQQDNFSDCGIFLLHYVEKFFEKPIENFELPIRCLQNWFNPEECKEKRRKIDQIIQNLSKSQTTVT